jgi:hypothetical protein
MARAWQENKDARRGAWHCPQCGYPLALSFSDWGEPLWIPAKIEFTSASEFEKKILPATLEQTPPDKTRRRFQCLVFPFWRSVSLATRGAMCRAKQSALEARRRRMTFNPARAKAP